MWQIVIIILSLELFDLINLFSTIIFKICSFSINRATFFEKILIKFLSRFIINLGFKCLFISSDKSIILESKNRVIYRRTYIEQEMKLFRYLVVSLNFQCNFWFPMNVGKYFICWDSRQIINVFENVWIQT